MDTAPLTPQGLRVLKPIPDAFVIDLSRAPSIGRDMALLLRQRPPTRRVPLVFVDGDPDKVAAIRRILPDAFYTTWARSASTIARAIAHPPTDPVVPGVFAPFAGVPLAQKLGIRPDSVVALIGAPKDFERTLRRLPVGATLRRGGGGRTSITLWFVRTRRELESNVRRMRPRAAGGGLWILWAKQSRDTAPEVTQLVVRNVGLANGLVDFKIARVDPTWSGLRFSERRRG